MTERSEAKDIVNIVKEEDVTKWLVRLEPLLELTEPMDDKAEELLENARAYVKDCHHWLDKGNLVLAFESMVHAFAIFETCKELGVFEVRKEGN